MEKNRSSAEKKGTVKKTKRRFTDIDFDLRSPLVRRVLLIVLGVMVVVFALYQIAAYRANRTTVQLSTQTALNRTITRSISAEGFVLREESILTGGANGAVVPRVENGSKVSAGDAVAEIFTSEAAAQSLLELDAVQAQIAYYEDIASITTGSIYENKDSYNQNISNALFRMLGAVSKNELSLLSDDVQEFSASVTKKQLVVGGRVDVTAKLAALYDRRDTLNSYITSGQVLAADRAGYYVDLADGYENAADYSTVLNATPQTVEQLLQAAPAQVSKNLGKLITQFNWYLLCSVDADEAKELEIGDKFKVSFSGFSGGPLLMELAAKNEGTDDKVALVLRNNLMNAEIASLRKENVKITLEEYTGYVVDKTALRTVDGEVGVYIQLGSLVKFRKVDIIYSDDSIALAAVNPANGYLRQFDEIITEGTDLYDGKIIT